MAQRQTHPVDTQANDFESFEVLVKSHMPKVYSLALRMMKSPAEAEEVVQDTFVSAWRNLPHFRGGAAFGTWLHRICVNVCLMKLRRMKAEASAASGEERLAGPRFDKDGRLLAPEPVDWAGGGEERALERELRRAIERAVEALPEEHRAVFLLKDIDGLSYAEIADATGATESSVKSRLHRARLALREAIDAFYREPEAVASGS